MKETINGVELQWQWTKIKAMEDKNVNDYIFFARDNVQKLKNEKHYLAVEKKYMNQLIPELLNENRHIYEILPTDCINKLYFDLELEKNGITNDECKGLLYKFLDWVNSKIQDKFNITMTKDYIILDSCRENKLSFHVISNDKIAFENMVTLKEFITFLNGEMEHYSNRDDFTWFHGDEKRYIFDTIPYGKDQCYRCINQSKHGKNHVLKNIDDSCDIDTLVRVYDEDCSLNVIMSNSQNIKEERKERKNEKKGNIESNVNEKFCITTGKNMMQTHHISIEKMKTLPLYLQYLYLIPNQSQSYEVFRNIGFALKSCGGSQEEYRSFAKLSPKYMSKTGGKLVERFPSFLLGKQCLKLPYLLHLAKICHIEYFDEGLERLNNYFEPSYDGIKIIEENTKYLSSLDNTIQEKIIILRAQLGGGKTTAIKKFIQDNKFIRILFVSPRITFSKFISTEFQSEFYLDEGANLNSNRLTISIESLHKIEFCKDYDLIIMDESEANLSVFSSSTMRHQLKCYDVLNNFIRKSKKTIMAGAFITKKTIDYAISFDLPCVCIYNSVKPNIKTAYRFHENILIIKLLESIERGDKNYCCFSSKSTMDKVVDLIRGKGFFKTKKILVYSSETDDNMINTLSDIEKSWGEADLVMTTPTITVGNSYKPIVIDYTNIFFYGMPTCCICDSFQSLKRVRETTSNNLFYSLSENMEIHKRFAPHKFEILKNFDLNNLCKTNQMKRLLQELINQYEITPLIYGLHIQKVKHFQCMFDERKQSPNSLKQLIISNFEEQTLSDCYYEKMFNKFLEINNYQRVENKEDLNFDAEKEIEYDILKNSAISCKIQYHEIPLIKDCDELEEYINKQTYKKCTVLDKKILEKYYFLEKINPKICENYKSSLFDVYSQVSNRYILSNSYDEQNIDIDNTILNGHIKNSTLENMTSYSLKLAIILKINLHLHIENSIIGNSIILREDIESLSSYFKKESSNIHIAFAYSKNKNIEWDFSKNLALLKKLYKSWNNASIISIKDIHKKVISCQLVPNAIFESNGTYINPFNNTNLHNFNKIPSIDQCLKSSKEIDNALKLIEQRKLKRQQDEIEDEKLLLSLKENEIQMEYNMNKQIEKQQIENSLCKNCKKQNKTCTCIKIDTFFN